jgi:2-amino-4-hydroxy-6-hydroxymethyldihydropteridine diphosphokinase
MKRVFLSLGSNLGDREENLREALRRLGREARLRLLAVSSVYETEPMDLRTQPWFLNLVAEADAEGYPIQLLGRIGRIEAEMGRKRAKSKGPRVIDIDILLFSSFIIDLPALVVPHPRMTERRFVLEPMVELAPDLRHPIARRSMRELLGEIKGQSVKKAAVSISVDSL